MTVSRSLAALRRAGAAAVVAMLAGCASGPSYAPDPLREPPKADEGAVAVSITANTAQVAGTDSLLVKQVGPGPNEGKRMQLLQTDRGLSRDTSLFVGVLPAGEYEFDTLSDNSTHQSLTLSASGRQRIGHFRVEPGKPTDLGRLVVTPLNTSVVVGRSALTGGNVTLMQRFSPKEAALFTGTLGGGWLEPRHADDRVEEYALSRPVGADNPVELKDGTVVAASRMGTVLVRKPGGRYRALRSPGIESLLYVAPVEQPDTVLLAAGELGTLLRQPAGQDKLVPVNPGDLPAGNLLFIDGGDSAGWYVAVQQHSAVTLYHSSVLEGGHWAPMRTEDVAFSFWSGANPFFIWARPGGLGYAVGEGRLAFLDYASGRWTERKSAKDNRIIALVHNVDGSLGILTSPGGGFAGIFASVYESRDDAQTWTEITPDFKVKVAPVSRTPDHRLLVPGGVLSNNELHASDDDGKTWRKVSDFQLDQRLVVLPSGRLLAIGMGRHGLFDIHTSVDGGEHWQLDYSNFDRAAYDASRAKP